ncbi:DUF4112 domain-containing protein [Spirulina major]|uniref:DUF4112 domain-containing protein n=1 Tax=Spirulina major TaxID=270636 RepID=UPI00093358B8|nr:DUF4112 domain-containing protein [Spirulina major]
MPTPNPAPTPTTSNPSPETATLERLRKLTRLLDEAIAIPGTDIRLGLDPILGLLPAAGDYISLGVSTYIIWQAYRLGTAPATLGRMVVNLLIDALVGTIPAVGDFFDVAWKANVQNLALLETHMASGPIRERRDRWFLVALVVGMGAIALITTGLSLLILRAILYRLAGAN